MRLLTKRLLIRDLSFRDFDDYYEYAVRPTIGPMAGWKPIPNEEVGRRVFSSMILQKDVFAIELLEKLSGDRYEYISWWCFEKDFGRRVDINVYERKGEDQIVPTDTAEDLYDLITQNLQEKAS